MTFSVPGPADALRECEVALRQLIRAVLSAERADWFEHYFSERVRARANEVMAEDEAKRARKGLLPEGSPDLLEFVEFYAYFDMMSRHWSLFQPALGPLSRMRGLLETIADYRNDIAHSRPLLPYQALLVAGVSGLIRNMVTIYMSAQDPAGEYYPRLESFRDSFGLAATDAQLQQPDWVILQSEVILRPGAVVGFEIVGVDPQGRDLVYKLRMGMKTLQTETAASGASAKLTWLVEAADVRESQMIEVLVSSADGPYHRRGRFDCRVHVTYIVRPPI